MPTEYKFDRDIFLVTDNPVARESTDRINPDGSGCVNDYTDGRGFALDLMRQFPGGRTLIDLGTATGNVPLTMRQAGLMAVGLEGSDTPQERNIGAWSAMPEVVRTCDIGRPFKIVDGQGQKVRFDYVTAWDVLEHIPETNIRQFLANADALMGSESLLILEFSLAYNPADGYHQLWEQWEDGSRKDAGWDFRDKWLRELLAEYFIIDESIKSLRDWDYCRPSSHERRHSRENGLDMFPLSRPLWWLRKRQ